MAAARERMEREVVHTGSRREGGAWRGGAHRDDNLAVGVAHLTTIAAAVGTAAAGAAARPATTIRRWQSGGGGGGRGAGRRVEKGCRWLCDPSKDGNRRDPQQVRHRHLHVQLLLAVRQVRTHLP